MSQKDDAVNQRKRSLFERPPSETLLRGRSTSRTQNENSPAIHQPTTQNSITPATVRRPPALPLTNAAGVHRPSTTQQEQCQTINQNMLDFFVSTKITESSTWAENKCDELNKFIVAEKERLEADAKSRLKIDIELRCREPLRSIDSLLIDQFGALEIQNRELNSRLSAMSKERNDACNKLNRQMAEVRVLETQLVELRNLSEQAMHDRNNAQSKLTVAVDEINTLSTTLQSNEQRFSEQKQRVDHYRNQAQRAIDHHNIIQSKLTVAVDEIETLSTTLQSNEQRLAEQQQTVDQFRHQAEQAQLKLNVAVGDINKLRTTLHSNEQQISNLQLQLEMTLQKHDGLEDKKEAADAQAVLARGEMNRMEFAILQYKKCIDTLTNDNASLKSRLSASNESMDNVSIRLTELQQQLSVMTGERDKALMELGMATSKMSTLSNAQASHIEELTSMNASMKTNIEKLREMVDHHHDNAKQAITDRDIKLLQICGLKEELLQANVAIEERRSTCLSNEGEIATLSTKLSEMESLLANATEDVAALTDRNAYLEDELKNATMVSEECNCREHLLSVQHALQQSENQLEILREEIDCFRTRLDQKNQFITDLQQTISHYESNEDKSLSVSDMLVENDHNDINVESNDDVLFENNDDVILETNDNDESIIERNDYEEIIADLKDRNVSLESQLLQATTKKYGPISTRVTLQDIPEESKLTVQSLSQSYANTPMPVIPAKIMKAISDICNWNNFVNKIWKIQKKYMKVAWKELKDVWNYPGCPETFTEDYMIEIVGMVKEPFARHLVSTVPLLSQDAVLVLHGNHGLELEHMQSRNLILHKTWADEQPNPCNAIMSIYHFSLAHFAPSKANNVKGSMFIANFERVVNEDGTTNRWINTGHDSDQLHYAFVVYWNEVISWYTHLDPESMYLDPAVICLRRKKDFEYEIGFQNLPNFNRSTGEIEDIQDETEVTLALAAGNETIQNSLRTLNEHCAELVIFGKRWNVGTDTTDSNNLLSNIGFVENELKECTHFGPIAISGEVITELRRGIPGDFVLGDRSGNGVKRLKGLLHEKLDLYNNLNSQIVDARSTTKGPVNNTAIIYRKRLYMFILNAFYGSTNNEQRWRMLNKFPGGGYIEMSIVDSISAIQYIVRNIK